MDAEPVRAPVPRRAAWSASPGQTTASVTPSRGPTRRPGWRRRWPVRSSDVALHVEVRGLGSAARRSCTDSRRPAGLWGSLRRPAGERRTRWSRVDLPGHGGSDVGAGRPARRRPGSWPRRSAAPIGDDAPAPCSGTRWVPGWPFMWRSEPTLPCSRVVLIGATGGIEDPEARASAAGGGRGDWPTRSRLRATSDAFIDSLGARPACSPGWRERRRASTNAAATAPPAWPRACACAAPGPRNRCGTAWLAVECPVLALAGTDDIRFAAHALRLARLGAARRRLVGPRWGPRRASGATRTSRADRHVTG